ncbi:MAG: GNAT family N-acetyltransferase [Bacteroidia bacterium]
MNNYNKIQLRLPNANDFDLMVDIELNPENRNYTSLEMPDLNEIRAFLVSVHDLRKHEQIRFVIECNSEGVGFIDLYDTSFLLNQAYVGILIKSKFRSLGIGSAALTKLKVVASTYGLKRLNAIVKTDNINSINFFHKNGFKQEETLENEIQFTFLQD